MNENLDNSDELAKRAKLEKTLRAIWTVLLVVFALLIVFDFYQWTQGKGNLRSILSPFGFIFLGAAMLIRPRNAMLANVLTGIAIVIVVTGLILMIIY